MAEPKKKDPTRARGPECEAGKGDARRNKQRSDANKAITYGPHRPVLSRLRSDTLSLDSPLVPVPQLAIQLTVILTVGACLVG